MSEVVWTSNIYFSRGRRPKSSSVTAQKPACDAIPRSPRPDPPFHRRRLRCRLRHRLRHRLRRGVVVRRIFPLGFPRGSRAPLPRRFRSSYPRCFQASYPRRFQASHLRRLQASLIQSRPRGSRATRSSRSCFCRATIRPGRVRPETPPNSSRNASTTARSSATRMTVGMSHISCSSSVPVTSSERFISTNWTFWRSCKIAPGLASCARRRLKANV
mmetsp:Transcript_14934/g.33222  ORF Transcript_14934/g.33222 Transcript_14934/m.33222 type:complete len:216 (-) Transcript_14934:3106-3753(-)